MQWINYAKNNERAKLVHNKTRDKFNNATEKSHIVVSFA